MPNETASVITQAKAVKTGPPQKPDASMPWGTRKCLLLFDYWRGARLIGKGTLAKASSEAKELASQYTEEQVTAVYKAMNGLQYWKARGGADIFNVVANISKEVRKLPTKPVDPPSGPPTSIAGMSEIEARELANKAAGMAKIQGREIDVKAEPISDDLWCIIIDWKTGPLESERFKTPTKFYKTFSEMCNIWRSSRQRKAVVNG
jgi:hypothetical protein